MTEIHIGAGLPISLNKFKRLIIAFSIPVKLTPKLLPTK